MALTTPPDVRDRRTAPLTGLGLCSELGCQLLVKGMNLGAGPPGAKSWFSSLLA